MSVKLTVITEVKTFLAAEALAVYHYCFSAPIFHVVLKLPKTGTG